MLKHLSDEHPESSPREIKFGMSVVKQHKNSFSRMIFESVLIYRGGSNILNSKSEYSRCQVPRLLLMVGEDQNNLKNNEVLKLKRKFMEETGSKPKRRRKHDDDATNSSDKGGSGHVNATSKDSKVLSTSHVMGPRNVSHNNIEKVITKPKFNLNPPTSEPKHPTKKAKKLNQNVKGQQKISFYFCDTQRELKPNVSCSSSPTRPPT